MLTAIAIASMAVGQVPQGVQDAGVDLFKQGGFASVAVVLAVVAAGAVWLMMRDRSRASEALARERQASIDASGKIIDLVQRFADLQVKSAESIATYAGAQRELATSINGLTQEVRRGSAT